MICNIGDIPGIILKYLGSRGSISCYRIFWNSQERFVVYDSRYKDNNFSLCAEDTTPQDIRYFLQRKMYKLKI